MQHSNDHTDASSPPERTHIFISYSHQDRKSLMRLQVHLKPYLDRSLVDFWDDTRIRAGDDWFAQIQQAITEAKIAILLISADYLASDFITQHELPPLLEAARSNLLTLLPIILSPCGFSSHSELSRIQAINLPSKPLSGVSLIY